MQLADLPVELPVETKKNLLRRLYRLPEHKRDLALRHAGQLLTCQKEKLGYKPASDLDPIPSLHTAESSASLLDLHARTRFWIVLVR